MEKSLPLVSVMMNCYNSQKFLRESIESALAQTYPNYEIIFWDNASTDESTNIAKSFNDPRFKYFRGEVNVPLYAARNLALEKCNGEFVSFLDCDDLWEKDKLEKQIPLFMKDDEVGLVFCDTIVFDGKGNNYRYFEKRKPYLGNCFYDLLIDYSLDIEAVVVRKSIIEKYKLRFDDRLNMAGDKDFFLRVAYYSKLDWVPEPLAWWRMHLESLSFQKPENFPIEEELLLNSLVADLPDIKKKNADLVEKEFNRIKLRKAYYAWANGKGSTARDILGDMKQKSFIWPFILGSYLPSQVFKMALTSLRKIIK